MTRGAQSPPAGAIAWRRLTLCADDYGISPAVSTAIRELIGQSRLNATSAMVTAPSFDRTEADRLSTLDDPRGRIAIGLHLVLTAPFYPLTPGYRPVTADGTFLPLAVTLSRALWHRLDADRLAAETRAQIGKFVSYFDRPPDFVDGHQHVHVFPQVRDAVLATVADMAPGAWVRQCGRAIPLAQRFADRKGLLLDLLSRRFCKVAGRYGLATNPAFAGTYDFTAALPFSRRFPRFLDHLPDNGLVMCHPGRVDAELERLDPLTAMRAEELSYFQSEEFPRLLSDRGFTLEAGSGAG